jgi:hypothetical protein
MNKLLALSSVPIAIAVVACSSDDANSLLGGGGTSGFATDPNSLASGPDNTFNHPKQPIGGDNGLTDPLQHAIDDQSIGSPEVVARMHGAQKLSYAALGGILEDLGVDLGNQNPGSAGELYRGGTQALGVANYANRVPEQIVPSTSSLAKQFDIFSAAAPEIIANIAMSKRCPGVVLVTNDQLTSDGVSCLLGKPARPEHVMLANQLVTEATTPQLGIQIAIATLLGAAHTSE